MNDDFFPSQRPRRNEESPGRCSISQPCELCASPTCRVDQPTVQADDQEERAAQTTMM